jgi:hypothetical protein
VTLMTLVIMAHESIFEPIFEFERLIMAVLPHEPVVLWGASVWCVCASMRSSACVSQSAHLLVGMVASGRRARMRVVENSEPLKLW